MTARRDAVALALVLPVVIVCGQRPVTGQQPDAAASAEAVGWASRCVSDSRDLLADCVAEQTVALQQGEARALLTIRLRVAGDGRETALLVQTPLGILLPAGVTIQVDAGEQRALALQTCDSNGCYTGTAVDDPLLAALRSGTSRVVSLGTPGGGNLTVPVPLAGFAEAEQRIR